MAVAMPGFPPESPEPLREQRFLVHGVSWKDYVVLREVLDTARASHDEQQREQ